MKARLSVFALSAILVVSIGMTPAFGQIQSSIVVTTDKPIYADGDTIVISGQVRDRYIGSDITVRVTAPNGQNVVYVDQVQVSLDKTFSTETRAGGTLMKAAGTYTVEVLYITENHSAQTSFEFEGIMDVVEPVDDTWPIEGTDDRITYRITGGTLEGIETEKPGSLIITIDAIEDGELIITIPKTILSQTTEDGVEQPFFVLVDASEEEFDIVTTEIDNKFTIQFFAGSEQIEIIGAWVIPEFGVIAVMILTVAIVSVIAISARSRLSIIPRY